MFTYDADESDTSSPEELGKVGLAEHFDWLDRNGDQTLTRAEYAETEWLYNTDSFGIVAIDLSRSVGDQIAWREQRAVPYIASPILYKGVLFAVKDGGILTSLDAETGEVLKRARIKGAVEPFYPLAHHRRRTPLLHVEQRHYRRGLRSGRLGKKESTGPQVEANV